MKLKELLVEGPDGLYFKGLPLFYDDDDALPFGMYGGEMYVGRFGDIHNDIAHRYAEFLPNDRHGFKYSGRLWENSKVISFWEYPKPNEMRKVIKELEDILGIDIWNKDWKVEIVIINNKEIYYGDIEDIDNDPVNKLIPITDYVGSEEQIGKEIDHIISPLKKKQKVTPSGIGSEKDSNTLPVKTHFYSRKGLGDGVIRFKEILYRIIEKDKKCQKM